jgi:hypothetical protein
MLPAFAFVNEMPLCWHSRWELKSLSLFLIFGMCVLDVLLQVTPVTLYAESSSCHAAGNESGLVQQMRSKLFLPWSSLQPVKDGDQFMNMFTHRDQFINMFTWLHDMTRDISNTDGT